MARSAVASAAAGCARSLVGGDGAVEFLQGLRVVAAPCLDQAEIGAHHRRLDEVAGTLHGDAGQAHVADRVGHFVLLHLRHTETVIGVADQTRVVQHLSIGLDHL
jgi:hypothetical protein